MVTKKEIEDSWNKNHDICLEIGNCIMCNRGQHGDIVIVKIPEGISRCLECAKKHNDDNNYEGKEGGRICCQI